jgi:hypothetical protein
MNITFENKIFHGVVDSSITKEVFIPIDNDLYKYPDKLSGKLNEIRQQLSNMKTELFSKAMQLDKDIVEWNSSYPRIVSMLEEMESTIADRLFLRSDTDGFYKTFYDNFSTTEKINFLDSENIAVNTDSNAIYLASRTGVKNPRDLDSSNIRLSLSRTPGSGIEKIVPIEGSNLNNLLQKNMSGWTGFITTNGSKSVGIILNVELNMPTLIGEMNFSMVDATNTATLSAIAIDARGVGTVLIENANVSNTNVIPVNKEVQKVQIVITKPGYDERATSGEYRYIFHLKRLSVTVEDEQIRMQKKGTFISSNYFIAQSSKLALEVCDFIPEDTSIDYFLKISPMDESGDPEINEIPITPINKPPGSSPYGIQLGYSKTNNNINKMRINPDVGNSTDIIPASNADLNTLGINANIINYSVATDTLNINNISVFGNYSELTIDQNEQLERIGNSYYTWIFITKSDTSFDTGTSGIEIEGLVKVGNTIQLSKTGWFKVKIPISSYINVGSNFNSLDDLKNKDPLFPYNGKYLIEGTNLKVAYYLGFSKRAKNKLTRVENLSLLNKDSYYLIRRQTNVGSVFNVVLSTDNSSKNAYIEYQEKQQDLFYYVSLVAKLKSTNETRTPILSSYKIKVGD